MANKVERPKNTRKSNVSKSTNTITKSRKTKDKTLLPTKIVAIDTVKSVSKKNPMIPLNELRSHVLISTLDYETKVKLEGVIKSLIKEL
jgi:hypothetical protein